MPAVRPRHETTTPSPDQSPAHCSSSAPLLPQPARPPAPAAPRPGAPALCPRAAWPEPPWVRSVGAGTRGAGEGSQWAGQRMSWPAHERGAAADKWRFGSRMLGEANWQRTVCDRMPSAPSAAPKQAGAPASPEALLSEPLGWSTVPGQRAQTRGRPAAAADRRQARQQGAAQQARQLVGRRARPALWERQVWRLRAPSGLCEPCGPANKWRLSSHQHGRQGGMHAVALPAGRRASAGGQHSRAPGTHDSGTQVLQYRTSTCRLVRPSSFVRSSSLRLARSAGGSRGCRQASVGIP